MKVRLYHHHNLPQILLFIIDLVTRFIQFISYLLFSFLLIIIIQFYLDCLIQFNIKYLRVNFNFKYFN